MEHIHYLQPTSSSLVGNKRKQGQNYNNTLVIHDNKAVKYATATMAQPGTQYKRKFKKSIMKTKKVWAPKVTKKLIKDLMQPEVKSIDGVTASWYPSSGNSAAQITLLNPLVQGVTRNSRIGNKVQGISIDFKIQAQQTVYKGNGTNPIWQPQNLEYMIVQQKAAQKSVMLMGDIKDTNIITDAPMAYHAYLGDRKTKVLYRGVIDVDGGSSGENNYREGHVPLKCTTTFVGNVGTIADIQENAIYLVLMTPADIYTSTGGTYIIIYPTYQCSWRYKYIDV